MMYEYKNGQLTIDKDFTGKIFVTADTHFGHRNIIKYTNRPYSSVEEMDKNLINNWNNFVSPNDLVIHLGDFVVFPQNKSKDINYYLSMLNGNIFLISGNHDDFNEKIDQIYDDKIFYTEENSIVQLNYTKSRIILCHYPLLEWNKKHTGVHHLFGHVHSGCSTKKEISNYNDYGKGFGISYDIGVDNNNYIPIEINRIFSKLDKIKLGK